jgi:UDP-3-O-[3-hydroxymyristoyl] glucosamine N-acyltransferase
MRLSELRNITPFCVRDASFSNLGLLNHTGGELLVCFYDANFEKALLGNPHISAVITTKSLAERIPSHLGVVVADQPIDSFYKIHEFLLNHTSFYGERWDSVIDSKAKIDDGVFISKFNVRIGAHVRITRGTQIHSGTEIGMNAVLGPNVIVGYDGFEPKRMGDRLTIVPHGGGVKLDEGVEVLANSNIAKSVFSGVTKVGRETKIDALVNISHNVSIGDRCRIAANASIAGSTSIGNDVWIGPGSIISSGICLGDRCYVVLGSVVTSSIVAGSKVAGNPARVIGVLKD